MSEYEGDDQDCVDEATGPINEGQANFFHAMRDFPTVSVQRGGIQYPVESVDLDGPIQSLSREQDARVTALHQARQVLESRGMTGRSAPPMETLVRLTHYILTGEYVDDVRNVG